MDIPTVTEQLLEKFKVSMEQAFDLGVKYRTLELVERIVNLLKEHEFNDEEISAFILSLKVTEHSTYADILNAE